MRQPERMTSRVDELQALLRRLTVSKELNDELVLAVLEACSVEPIDKIAKKYDLVELCEVGAWEQAALWIFRRALPRWTLVLELGDVVHRVSVTSPHLPPFELERRGSKPGTLILESIVQSRLGLARLNLEDAV